MASEKLDQIILACLAKNARMSAQKISLELKNKGINRTSRSVLTRIHKLEKENKINGYTLRLDAKNFEGKIIRFVLISFKTSKTFNEHITTFTSYLQNAPFTAFAARTRGQYDWINIKVFPNSKIANQESDTYRTLFGNIIDQYVAYDLSPIKTPDFVRAVNYSNEEFHKFLVKWLGK